MEGREKTVILDESATARAIMRISHEIAERNKGAENVVLIGVMAKHMELSKEEWLKTIEATVPQKFIEMNKKAFELGYKR